MNGILQLRRGGTKRKAPSKSFREKKKAQFKQRKKDELEKAVFDNPDHGKLIQGIGSEMANMAEAAIQGISDPKELLGAWADLEKQILEAGVHEDVIAKMRDDWKLGVEALEIEKIEKEIKENIVSGVESAFDFIPSNALTRALGLDIVKKEISKAIAKAFITQEITDAIKKLG